MIIKILITFFVLITGIFVNAQEFDSKIDRDSLFNRVLSTVPIEKRDEIKKEYEQGNVSDKEFLLFMLSMPRSSKEDLIKNFEQKHLEILNLKTEYNKIIPNNFVVDIEFNPENKIIKQAESIDLKIFKKKTVKTKSTKNNDLQRNDGLEVVSQNWDLDYNSPILMKEIKRIGWSQNTLKLIQKLLKDANCISIKNGEKTNIGFARSGMGKYSYDIFENKLSQNEITEFSDGCTYIYYKENVVLEYGGGAIGPQCFPKEN